MVSRKRLLVVIAFVLALLLVIPASVTADTGVSVAIDCALDVPVGGTADIDITINTDDPQGIGAATITLTCDSSVVTVDNVSGGDLGGVTFNTVGDTTTMTVATGSSPGPAGSVLFGTVRLNAVGSAGQSSALDIEVTSLYDGTAGDPQPITPDEVIDCTFSIGPASTPTPTPTSSATSTLTPTPTPTPTPVPPPPPSNNQWIIGEIAGAVALIVLVPGFFWASRSIGRNRARNATIRRLKRKL